MSCQGMSLGLRVKKSKMTFLTCGILGCKKFARISGRNRIKLGRYLIIQ